MATRAARRSYKVLLLMNQSACRLMLLQTQQAWQLCQCHQALWRRWTNSAYTCKEWRPRCCRDAHVVVSPSFCNLLTTRRAVARGIGGGGLAARAPGGPRGCLAGAQPRVRGRQRQRWHQRQPWQPP